MTSSGARLHLPNGRTRLLGIVGHPLDHSLSPALHTAVLRMLERNLIYIPFTVSAERLGSFLRHAGEIGVLGLNVTTPYKELARKHVVALDSETERTGMVNTIHFRSEGPIGTGTDGAGILRWLAANDLLGEPFGVLGFGPTARSLIHRAWLEGHPPMILLTRRPDEARAALNRWQADSQKLSGQKLSGQKLSGQNLKGQELKGLELNGQDREGQNREVQDREGQELEGSGPQILDWNELAGRGPRLPQTWISMLPAEAAPLPVAFWSRLPSRSRLLDLNYGDGRDAIQVEARSHGLVTASGLGPLLHQAALSLSLWLGEPVSPELFRKTWGGPARLLKLGRR